VVDELASILDFSNAWLYPNLIDAARGSRRAEDGIGRELVV